MSYHLPDPSSYVVLMSTPPEGEGEIITTESGFRAAFKFEFLHRVDVPDDAAYDNWLEVDGRRYQVYAMPGSGGIGASFALTCWAERLFDDDEDEPEEETEITNNCPRCKSPGPFKSTGFDSEYQCEKCGAYLMYTIIDDDD